MTKRKIVLNSNFTDYYDYQFETKTSSERLHLLSDENYFFHYFNRNSTNDISRTEQFEILNSVGFETLEFKKIKDWTNKKDRDLIVVHLDEYSHRGDNKKLMTYLAALQNYPEYKATEFVRTISGNLTGSKSYRLLSIGGEIYAHLKYISDFWKSNMNPKIEILDINNTPSKFLWNCQQLDKKYPLWAIDFICKPNSFCMYAIDLNTSPGLKDTGLEDRINPKEIYNAIYNWYEEDNK